MKAIIEYFELESIDGVDLAQLDDFLEDEGWDDESCYLEITVKVIPK